MTERKIFITEIDLERLEELIQNTREGLASGLESELARATIVNSKDIPPDVVTMNSRVVFEDTETGNQRTVTLTYPSEADATADRISILAPVGSALLGLSVGQNIEWPVPSGRKKNLSIVSVLYQPEAAGDLHL